MMSVYLVVLIIIALQFQSKLENLFCKTTLNITIQQLMSFYIRLHQRPPSFALQSQTLMKPFNEYTLLCWSFVYFSFSPGKKSYQLC